MSTPTKGHGWTPETGVLRARMSGPNISWARLLQHLKLPHRVRNSGAIDLLCVFHREKTPSLRLWPNGGFFCHGCLAQGSKLDFIQQIWGLEEADIVEFLAGLVPVEPEQLSIWEATWQT